MDEKILQEIIIDLQTRLAFQEDSLESLNLTVARQQSENGVLKREILWLKDLVEDIRESQGSEDGAVELPPHY